MLGECLLILSLSGKALRTPVESRGLSSDSICVLKAESGKLDINRRNLSVQLTHCFTLQTSDYDVIIDLCVYSASLATSLKKCNVIMT